MRVPTAAKRALYPIAAGAFGMLRAFRFPRVAREAASYLDLLPFHPRWSPRNRRYWPHYRRSFIWDEQVPGAAIASQGLAVHRPIRSTCLVLDTGDSSFSFRNNIVIDPERRAVFEEVGWTNMSVRVRLLEAPKRVDGTVVYLSNTEVGNYYHWMCLTLPLLGIYRNRLGVEPDFCYVGKPPRGFQIETLARAGIPAERILNQAVSANRLVAALVDRNQAVNREMLQYTRDLFPPPKGPGTRRLFIARGTRWARRLINEDQCYAFLKENYGFERVVMEGLPVAEQANLIAQAEAIVAPHGAALTNLLFARPRTRVLELLSIDYAPVSFFEIATFVGCRYDRVLGQNLPGQDRRQIHKADFHVDLEAFKVAASRLFEERMSVA